MGSRERYVVVTIAALAIILAMALSRGFEWFWITMEWNDPRIAGISQLPLTSLISYVISIEFASVCLKHESIYQETIVIV